MFVFDILNINSEGVQICNGFTAPPLHPLATGVYKTCQNFNTQLNLKIGFIMKLKGESIHSAAVITLK